MDDEVRENWREIPVWLLREEELALLSNRELTWRSGWLADNARDRDRIALVDAGVRTAERVEARCGNCHDWRNGGGVWGGCWSMDGQTDPLTLPIRVTLAVHRCEAWCNPNAIYVAQGYVGIDYARAHLKEMAG